MNQGSTLKAMLADQGKLCNAIFSCVYINTVHSESESEIVRFILGIVTCSTYKLNVNRKYTHSNTSFSG